MVKKLFKKVLLFTENRYRKINEFPLEEPVIEENNSSGVSLQKDGTILKDDDPSMQHMTKEPEIDLPSSEMPTE